MSVSLYGAIVGGISFILGLILGSALLCSLI